MGLTCSLMKAEQSRMAPVFPEKELEGQSRHLLKWEERQRRREWWGVGRGKGRGAPEGRAEMEPGQAPRVCSTSKERRRAHSRVGEPAIRGKV